MSALRKKRWTLLATAAALVSAVGVGRAEETVDACRSVDDPVEELFFDDEQCEPRPQIKTDKTYPAMQGTVHRRGLNPILTTLYNVHSREAVPVFRNVAPDPDVIGELLRCRGFGVRAELDPRLLQTVLAAAEEFASPRVRIISAYRSPKFNDALAKKGRGVASESRHTRGEAIDFGLATVEAVQLGRWLWEHFDGGVGTYANNDFVHIDVGPKRRWSGR